MSEVLDLGEVDLPDWRPNLTHGQADSFARVESEYGLRAARSIYDLSFVRKAVINRSVGRMEEVDFYSVLVRWPDGEEQVWRFERRIALPIIDGVARDFNKEMIDRLGGEAA